MSDDQGQSAAWYPAPDRPGQQRYWDGTEWTDHYAPVPPPRTTPRQGGAKRVLVPVLACLALVLVLGVVGAVAGDGDDSAERTTTERAARTEPETTGVADDEETDVPASTTTEAATTTPTTAPLTVPASCVPADAQDIEFIEGFLRNGATIGEAFTDTNDDGRWVTANIYPAGGGDRLATLAEWVFVGNALTTSSSSATEHSRGTVEGRDIGVSPAARPEGLDECLRAALRAQNGG